MDKNKSNNVLSRDDLFLLMKSYENSVTLNTTLLEYQKQLLNKQNELLDKQNNLCTSINQILIEIKTNIKTSDTLNTNIKQLSNECANFKSETAVACSNLSKEHIGINMRAYLGYAGLGTIIISLISLIYKLFSKFNLIDLIAKKLGV